MSDSGAAARRARDKRERREAILDAAASVFARRGAGQATMEDVAEAAEVSKGTLYLYFKSKDDLFVALTHRPLDAVLERFEALVRSNPEDGASLLRSLLLAHAEVVQAHAANFRVAMSSMCGGFAPDPSTPSLRAYATRLRALRGNYITAIERGMSDGSLRADLAPTEVAAALWAGMFGATFLRMNAPQMQAQLAEDERVNMDHVVPFLADLLLRALRPVPHAASEADA